MGNAFLGRLVALFVTDQEAGRGELVVEAGGDQPVVVVGVARIDLPQQATVAPEEKAGRVPEGGRVLQSGLSWLRPKSFEKNPLIFCQ